MFSLDVTCKGSLLYCVGCKESLLSLWAVCVNPDTVMSIQHMSFPLGILLLPVCVCALAHVFTCVREHVCLCEIVCVFSSMV